jgi:hypothetical protein
MSIAALAMLTYKAELVGIWNYSHLYSQLYNQYMLQCVSSVIALPVFL